MIGYLDEHSVNWDIAKRYQLGVVLAPVAGDERFTGMLAIPYLSPSGVNALKFRNLNKSGPKFAQRLGQKVRLFNPAAYFAADDVIGVAEGEVDAIIATEKLGIPSLGVPGAETWRKYAEVWIPLFRDFRTVLIFADGDQAGRDLAAELAESLGWRARIVHCPDGEDVSSMVTGGNSNVLLAKCSVKEED